MGYELSGGARFVDIKRPFVDRTQLHRFSQEHQCDCILSIRRALSQKLLIPMLHACRSCKLIIHMLHSEV